MLRARRLRAAGALLALGCSLFTLSGGVARAATTVFSGTTKSFDLVDIAYSVFLPGDAGPSHQVPVIFMTHGWGGSRATSETDADVKRFLDADYAVVTWDSRGFGASGGDANVDAQEYEVRDLQTLITFVAGGQYNPGPAKTGAHDILTDDGETVQDVIVDCGDDDVPDAEGLCHSKITSPPRDPRMGMYGGSYAGGIQLMGASADSRIDAIAPQIAWNDLVQALKPNGVIKLGWDTLLYADGLATSVALGLPTQQTGSLAKPIHQSLVESTVLNDWTQSTVKWFDSKSPKNWIGGGLTGDNTRLPGLNVPTLIIQGTSDTLFTLNQGIANYDQIRARIGNDKVKMMWFCGGHTLTIGDTVAVPNTPSHWPAPIPDPAPAPAPSEPPHTNINPTAPTSCHKGDQSLIGTRAVAWMNRWLRGDTGAQTGAPLEYQLQDGSWHSLLNPAGQPASDLPTQTVAAIKNIKSTATHLIVPTSGQVTAPTPAGCIASTGTGTLGTAQQVRDIVNYENVCTYPLADWIPIGTYTGIPPYKCGPVVLKKAPCLPTFEQIKPGTILLGAPHMHVRVTATTPVPDAMLFFKVIDYNVADQSRIVIDDQVTPLRISWPDLNNPQWFDFDLNGVAWQLQPGHQLYLEMSPSSNDYSNSRFPSSLSTQIDATFPGISPLGSFNTEKLLFGPTAMQSVSAPQTVTLQNTGAQTLTLGQAQLNQFTSYGGPVLNITTGAPVPSKDYTIETDACSNQTLEPLQTCTVSMHFNPSLNGTKVAGLLVPGNNGPVQPFPVLLFGTATTPLNPSPTRLGFGFVQSGTSSAVKQVTLRNLSPAPITVSSEVASGDTTQFTLSNDLCVGATIAPNASCTIDVQYKPTAVKAHVATIKFKNNGAASCATTQNQCEQVVLSGTADRQPPSITESSPTGGTSTPTTATKDIVVEGEVTDAVGVTAVKVHIVNDIGSVGEGLQIDDPNNPGHKLFEGSAQVYDAVCVTGCGGPDMTYSLTISPGTGSFHVYVEAFNTFGLSSKGPTHWVVVTPV
jgi:hypothetical protein